MNKTVLLTFILGALALGACNGANKDPSSSTGQGNDSTSINHPTSSDDGAGTHTSHTSIDTRSQEEIERDEAIQTAKQAYQSIIASKQFEIEIDDSNYIREYKMSQLGDSIFVKFDTNDESEFDLESFDLNGFHLHRVSYKAYTFSSSKVAGEYYSYYPFTKISPAEFQEIEKKLLIETIVTNYFDFTNVSYINRDERHIYLDSKNSDLTYKAFFSGDTPTDISVEGGEYHISVRRIEDDGRSFKNDYDYYFSRFTEETVRKINTLGNIMELAKGGKMCFGSDSHYGNPYCYDHGYLYSSNEPNCFYHIDGHQVKNIFKDGENYLSLTGSSSFFEEQMYNEFYYTQEFLTKSHIDVDNSCNLHLILDEDIYTPSGKYLVYDKDTSLFVSMETSDGRTSFFCTEDFRGDEDDYSFEFYHPYFYLPKEDDFSYTSKLSEAQGITFGDVLSRIANAEIMNLVVTDVNYAVEYCVDIEGDYASIPGRGVSYNHDGEVFTTTTWFNKQKVFNQNEYDPIKFIRESKLLNPNNYSLDATNHYRASTENLDLIKMMEKELGHQESETMSIELFDAKIVNLNEIQFEIHCNYDDGWDKWTDIDLFSLIANKTRFNLATKYNYFLEDNPDIQTIKVDVDNYKNQYFQEFKNCLGDSYSFEFTDRIYHTGHGTTYVNGNVAQFVDSSNGQYILEENNGKYYSIDCALEGYNGFFEIDELPSTDKHYHKTIDEVIAYFIALDWGFTAFDQMTGNFSVTVEDIRYDFKLQVTDTSYYATVEYYEYDYKNSFWFVHFKFDQKIEGFDNLIEYYRYSEDNDEIMKKAEQVFNIEEGSVEIKSQVLGNGKTNLYKNGYQVLNDRIFKFDENLKKYREIEFGGTNFREIYYHNNVVDTLPSGFYDKNEALTLFSLKLDEHPFVYNESYSNEVDTYAHNRFAVYSRYFGMDDDIYHYEIVESFTYSVTRSEFIYNCTKYDISDWQSGDHNSPIGMDNREYEFHRFAQSDKLSFPDHEMTELDLFFYCLDEFKNYAVTNQILTTIEQRESAEGIEAHFFMQWGTATIYQLDDIGVLEGGVNRYTYLFEMTGQETININNEDEFMYYYDYENKYIRIRNPETLIWEKYDDPDGTYAMTMEAIKDDLWVIMLNPESWSALDGSEHQYQHTPFTYTRVVNDIEYVFEFSDVVMTIDKTKGTVKIEVEGSATFEGLTCNMKCSYLFERIGEIDLSPYRIF